MKPYSSDTLYDFLKRQAFPISVSDLRIKVYRHTCMRRSLFLQLWEKIKKEYPLGKVSRNGKVLWFVPKQHELPKRKQFATVSETDLKKFGELVNECLNNGWELHGEMQSFLTKEAPSGWQFIQAMTKEGE